MKTIKAKALFMGLCTSFSLCGCLSLGTSDPVIERTPEDSSQATEAADLRDNPSISDHIISEPGEPLTFDGCQNDHLYETPSIYCQESSEGSLSSDQSQPGSLGED